MKSNSLFRLLVAFLLLGAVNSATLQATESNEVNANSNSTSVSYYSGSWEAAKEEARRTGKGIFVKMWATWCVNCRVMDDNVFNDKRVAEFYNDNFVNYSLDYDSPAGQEFARKYDVQFLPDFFFFDSNANLVLRATEGKTQTQMLDFGYQATGSNATKLVNAKPALYENTSAPVSTKHIGTYNENLKIYESGHDKKVFLRNFAVQSKQLNREYEPIANKFLKKAKWSREDWDKPENQQFLFEFADKPESKAIKYVLNNKDALTETYGRFNVESRLKHGLRNFVITASAENKKRDFRKALRLVKKAKLKNNKDFKHEVRLSYFSNANDWKLYAKEINHYANSFDGLDPIKLNIAAWNIHNHSDKKRVLRKAAKWCEKSIEISSMYYNQETYAHILHKLGRKKQAQRAVLRALVLAGKEGKANTRAEILAQEIDASK